MDIRQIEQILNSIITSEFQNFSEIYIHFGHIEFVEKYFKSIYWAPTNSFSITELIIIYDVI